VGHRLVDDVECGPRLFGNRHLFHSLGGSRCGRALDFIGRPGIVVGSPGGGTPDAPKPFGFLGPLEGNPLTIPALGLVFLLFGVAAIRRRLVRTERVRGRYPQAEVEAAGQGDAWDM